MGRATIMLVEDRGFNPLPLIFGFHCTCVFSYLSKPLKCIHSLTDTEEHAIDFLSQKGILKPTMVCPSCSTNMTLVACSRSKSPDFLALLALQKVQIPSSREHFCWAGTLLSCVPDTHLLHKCEIPDEHSHSTDDGVIREHRQ